MRVWLPQLKTQQSNYGLIDFTDFAVQFRYATVEEEDELLDRLAMIQQVTELMDHVKQLLVDTEEDIEQ
jgi:hypothetical protein